MSTSNENFLAQASAAPATAWPINREVVIRADRPYDYQLWTALPARYERYPQSSYPLLMCLDAQWTFGCATDAVRILASNGQMPRCIVAGLTFNTDHAREVAQLRARDFTLTQATAPAATGVQVPAEQLGGAAQFVGFLLADILPRLRARYRIGELVFVGHSMSALLGLYLLLHHTTVFQRYLLASPSVWWDESCVFEHFSKARRARAELEARVFMSTGELETGPLARHTAFAEHLRHLAFERLELEFQQLEHETHLSTVGASVWRGLRWLLPADPSPSV